MSRMTPKKNILINVLAVTILSFHNVTSVLFKEEP